MSRVRFSPARRLGKIRTAWRSVTSRISTLAAKGVLPRRVPSLETVPETPEESTGETTEESDGQTPEESTEDTGEPSSSETQEPTETGEETGTADNSAEN